MKSTKILSIFIVLCTMTFFSCEQEEVENADTASKDFWENSGDDAYLQKSISVLKSLSTVEDFKSETLSLGTPDWDHALNILSSNGDFVLHVPLVNRSKKVTTAMLLLTNHNASFDDIDFEIDYVNRDMIIGLKDKIQFDYSGYVWTSLFKNMDRDVFNVQNGSKGFIRGNSNSVESTTAKCMTGVQCGETCNTYQSCIQIPDNGQHCYSYQICIPRICVVPC